MNMQPLLSIQPDAIHTQYQHFYVNNIPLLKNYRDIELNIFVYPYSRHLNADSFTFLPYEEYVQDVVAKKGSTYEPTSSNSGKLFGLGLGSIILILFYLLAPQELVSVESVVSIFAAYTIGKELWGDIENFFVGISKNWKIRWVDNEYRYSKQDFGTIQKFWDLARFKRNKAVTTLPVEMDFINQSNSKSVDLKFKRKQLFAQDKTALILSYKMEKENLAKFTESGVMIGVKATLSKRFLFIQYAREIFQALDTQNRGVIDTQGVWQPGKALLRKTLTIGRIKFYLSNSFETQEVIGEKKL